MTLTPEQSSALTICYAFLTSPYNSSQPIQVLTGYAGTGKTTVLGQLKRSLTNVAFCAPTGKASMVLKSKGIDASTIHQLVYKKISENPILFERKSPRDITCRAIVIDEASMVDYEVLKDLLSLRKPLLFVGDPFQLPPVSQDPHLFNSDYPTARLETVHRQALDNPIISLATWLRLNPGRSPYAWYDANKDQQVVTVSPRTGADKLDPATIDQIICGKNVTRQKINLRVRKALNYASHRPVRGDRLICLRNDHKLGICNGQQFLANEDADDLHQELDIYDEVNDDVLSVEFFPDLFDTPELVTNPKACRRAITPLDYAYAITCHKAQGSEYDVGCVIDEPIGDPPNRWRYTAVTRFKKRLHYFM